MNTSRLFIYVVVLVLALFLQSCKSDSKETQNTPRATTQTAKPAQQLQRQAQTARPKPIRRDTLDAASNAKIKKVIDETNRKIDQTEKEVDKLLEGI